MKTETEIRKQILSSEKTLYPDNVTKRTPDGTARAELEGFVAGLRWVLKNDKPVSKGDNQSMRRR